MSFTAHNIQFSDGSITVPSDPQLLADSPWCLGTKRLLSTIYHGDVRGKRIADLGCLEGGFALEFARMGMQSTGIEVRPSNVANCRDVQRRASLPNLNFVQDDVWNVAAHGPFDVAFCSGLLYHLDRPRQFVKLMGSVARDAVIVNTHCAPWSGPSDFTLSELTEHDGMVGRWYYEHSLADPAALDSLKWASWSNQRSFWPVKEALIAAISEAGFDLVFEQFDTAAPSAHLYDALSSTKFRSYHRGWFVGIRTS